MNYCTPYPVATHPQVESVRDYFSDNVVCTIRIGIYQPSIAGTKQATLDPLARVLLVPANCFAIQKTALTGVAFLGDDDHNPHQ
jgi:hypothetical protein